MRGVYHQAMVEVSALLVSLIGLVLQGKERGANKQSARLKQSLFALHEFAQTWGLLARKLQECMAAWQLAGYPEDNDHGLLHALNKKLVWVARRDWEHADIEPLLEVYASDLAACTRLLELKRRSEENLDGLALRLMSLRDESGSEELDRDLQDFFARTDDVLRAVEEFRRFLARTYPLADQ